MYLGLGKGRHNAIRVQVGNGLINTSPQRDWHQPSMTIYSFLSSNWVTFIRVRSGSYTSWIQWRLRSWQALAVVNNLFASSDATNRESLLVKEYRFDGADVVTLPG